MYTLKTIKDELANIQSILLKNSIRKNTNIELLQGEKEIQEIFEKEAEKIKNLGNKLFSIEKNLVKSKTVITDVYFKELFNDIWMDLQTLYKHIEYVDTLLELNLYKNIRFFNTLEKHIIELDRKLNITRLNVNKITAFDKTYFESFSNNNTKAKFTNLIVDKKTGHMLLRPIFNINRNTKYNIKHVSTSTFPVHNPNGGVYNTTDILNTFENSYRKDGANDMLQNGLWKEQVYTVDVPSIRVYINKHSAESTFFDTIGIISYVDIEFTNAIDFNTIDIDLFGEFETTILGIFTKTVADETWKPLIKLKKLLINHVEYYIDSFGERSAFNILKYRNLELRNCKFLRIYFNQKHYSLILNKENEVDSTDKKIYKDLSEKRLELIKLDGGSDDRPAIPKSFDYESLYSDLTYAIEYSSNVDEMLKKINNIFNPVPKIINVDFSKLLKYEVGAWSIEPKKLQYIGEGKYRSPIYEYTDKAVVSIALDTEQEDIKENTCNWYIRNTINGTQVPIIPNDEIIRKEPINVINSAYLQKNGWKTGIFIQLDFPINIETKQLITLFEDGREIPITSLQYTFLNTRLLYIEDISDYNKHKYVILYQPAKFDTCNIYTLITPDIDDTLAYSVTSPRLSTLKLFLDILKSDPKYKEHNYTIKKVKITEYEYYDYFNFEFNLLLNKTIFNSLSAAIKTKLNKFLYIKLVEFFKEHDYNTFKNNYSSFDHAIGGALYLPTIFKFNERSFI